MNDKQELEKIKEIAEEAKSLYEETKKNVAWLQGFAEGYKAGLKEHV